jgi:hypothetical protein
MITARCNHCDETIYIADDEREDQILDSHQVHIMKYPQAAFIYEGTRPTLPGRKLTVYAQRANQ